MPPKGTTRIPCGKTDEIRDKSDCRERRKMPACLKGTQAGVNVARQMCRELNRESELSGYRESKRRLTGRRLERDWKIRRIWTASLFREGL